MTSNIPEMRTSVKLRNSTLKKLKKIGVMGDSYDDVISQLIRLYNGKDIENKGKTPDYVSNV